jgi:hypothetical protein
MVSRARLMTLLAIAGVMGMPSITAEPGPLRINRMIDDDDLYAPGSLLKNPEPLPKPQSSPPPWAAVNFSRHPNNNRRQRRSGKRGR